MAASLFEHELINTTVLKAKELRRVVEPLITLAKVDSVSNRRLAFARLRNKEMVVKLFEDLGPRNNGRPGGYMRILKNGFRRDDNAPMAVVELVERESVKKVEAAPVVEKSKPAPAAKKVAVKKADAKKAEAVSE